MGQAPREFTFVSKLTYLGSIIFLKSCLIWEKVKSYTNPKGYQAIQDHGNQPIQIPM